MAKNKAIKFIVKTFKKGYFRSGKEKTLTNLKGPEYRENSLFLPSYISSISDHPVFSKKELPITSFEIREESPIDLEMNLGAIILFEDEESIKKRAKKGLEGIEEELAQRTSYLLTRDNARAKEYEAYNAEAGPYGPSAILTAPKVEVLLNDNHEYIEPHLVTVVTTPLPDKEKFVLKGEEAYIEVIRERILNILKLCSYLAYEELSLPILDKEDTPVSAKTMANIYKKCLEEFSLKEGKKTASYKRIIFYGKDKDGEYRKTFLGK